MFTASIGFTLLAISYIFCPTSYLGSLCSDERYRYLLPLFVPTTAWFVIANWVGWEYFRYA
ncbi:hypothetical protein BCR39DRAFT_473677 [Naematelia encephala]|uniref:Uncharacterized protein n=1 Tax=Naematelia encephala TaxID=71784 RepID=A0A1Y2AJM2_9TREE|nr:hypothetical protein BCR39DRAFT_473677 [Naematelia encephala]